MDCRDVRRSLFAILDGEAAALPREAVDAHLAACPDCARAERAVRETRAHLAALPRPAAPEGLAERVRVRLTAPAARLAPLLPLLRAAAVAAGVLFAATTAAIVLHTPAAPVSPAALTADAAVERIMDEIVRDIEVVRPAEVDR